MKIFSHLILFFLSSSLKAQVTVQKKKMKWEGAFISNTVSVLTGVSDQSDDVKLLQILDSLPRNNSFAKVYYLLSDNDSTVITAALGKVYGRFQLARFYKNGNIASIAVYDGKFRRTKIYWECYEDMVGKLIGHYCKGIKTGKWTYYDTDYQILKKEKYRKGKLVKQKEYSPPKKQFHFGKIVKMPQGRKYSLKES